MRAGHGRELTLGALALALVAALFLGRGIVHLGDGYLSAANFSQLEPLTRAGEPLRPANPALREEWTRHGPWRMFAAAEIARGKLPVWNGWSGGGVPHLANPRTAVLSPWAWPTYVLGVRAGFVLAAWLALAASGYFALLYLRRIGLGFEAALAGGVAFAFSAATIVGLGTNGAAAACLLPAGCFALERLAQAFERACRAADAPASAWRARDPAALALLALALVAGWLAGAPEVFALAVTFLTLFGVARFVRAWSIQRREARVNAESIVLSAHVALVLALALGISAIQVLPYLEYARHSATAFESAPDAPPALALPSTSFGFVHDLLGRLGSGDFAAARAQAAWTTSALVVVLAGLGLCAARRRRTAWSFALLGGATYAAARGLASSGDADPTSEPAASVCAWCLAVGAAFGVDELVRAPRSRAIRAAIGLFVVALAVAAWMRSEALEIAAYALARLGSAAAKLDLAATATARVDAALAAFLGGIAVACVLALVRGARQKRGAALAAAAAILLSSAGPYWDWLVVTPDAHFHPRTAPIERLRALVQGADFVVSKGGIVPPATNVALGLRQITVDDGLRVHRQDQLLRRLFGGDVRSAGVRAASRRALELFGIDFVLDPDRWPAIDTAFPLAPRNAAGAFSSAPIVPEAPVVTEFSGVADGLDGLLLWFDSDGRRNEFALDVVLADARTGERFFGKRFAPGDVRPQGQRVFPWVLRFDTVPASKGRLLRLSISTPNARPERAFAVRCRTDRERWIDLAHWGAEGVLDPTGRGRHPLVQTWKARQGSAPIEGQIDLDLHHALEDFAFEAGLGSHVLYRYARGTSRFHTVGRAEVVTDDRAGWERVLARDFDPRREVVLEAVDPGFAGGARDEDPSPAVQILEEDHGTLHVRARRERPGWLVTTLPWYPGWRARVGGVDTPLACANYAFTAVPIPAGESDVELVYAPKSVRHGVAITIASVLLGAVWLGASARWNRR